MREGPVGREHEAKWLPSGPNAARSALASLGVPVGDPGRVERVDDLYLDTDDGRLRAAGWAYRLRRREDGKVDATLKSFVGEDAGGVLAREERTATIPRAVTDPARLPEGEPRDTLLAATDGRRLRPLARVRGTRTRWPMHPARGVEVEAALDDVRLSSNGAPPRARLEIEVERVGGTERAFRRWIGKVAPSVRARRAPSSKLEAALRAAGVRLPTPAEMRAARAALAPAPCARTPAADAAADALARLAGDLAKAVRGARRGAIEGAHDLRTGSRRIRSVLAAFRDEVPEAARRDLRDRLRALRLVAGDVRDLDVLAATIRACGTPVGRSETEALVARIASRRRAAARALSKALGDPALATIPDAVAAVADATRGRPSPPYVVAGAGRVPAALEEALANLAGLRGDPADAPAHALHALRIAAKKARYAAETFEPAFGKPLARFARAARAAQDALGLVQDAHASRDVVRRLAEGGGGAPARAAAAAASRALFEFERKARARVARRLDDAFGKGSLRALADHLARRAADVAAVAR